jgi:DNA-binding NarL/FixJ family response regulator
MGFLSSVCAGPKVPFTTRDFVGPQSRYRVADLDELTEREREVLTLIGLGHSNTEIAERLYVSMSTTKTHVGRLLMKLAARDRAQLVIAAYETGLVGRP